MSYCKQASQPHQYEKTPLASGKRYRKQSTRPQSSSICAYALRSLGVVPADLAICFAS